MFPLERFLRLLRVSGAATENGVFALPRFLMVRFVQFSGVGRGTETAAGEGASTEERRE